MNEYMKRILACLDSVPESQRDSFACLIANRAEAMLDGINLSNNPS